MLLKVNFEGRTPFDTVIRNEEQLHEIDWYAHTLIYSCGPGIGRRQGFGGFPYGVGHKTTGHRRRPGSRPYHI